MAANNGFCTKSENSDWKQGVRSTLKNIIIRNDQKIGVNILVMYWL